MSRRVARSALGIARRALGTAVTATIGLASTPARAHLLPAAHATLNLTGDSCFAVIAVPAETLSGVDDDHDARISSDELSRHQAAIREQTLAGFHLESAASSPRLVRIDLVLSPAHEGPADRGDAVVALVHFQLDAPASTLGVSTSLFDARGAIARWHVSASRDHRAETTVSVELTREQPTATLRMEAPAVASAPAPRPLPPSVWLTAIGVGGALAMFFARRGGPAASAHG